MSDIDNDVDLDEILGSEEEKSSGASADEQSAEGNGSKKGTQESESEDNLSPREIKRARELANEVAALRELVVEKFKSGPANATESSRSAAQDDLDAFLQESVKDEASRQVLRKMAGIMESKIEQKYAPQLSKVRKVEAESEFSDYVSKIPSLARHKSEIFKTLESNPDKSLRGIIGDIIVESTLSKIKPVESTRSQASRETPDLDSMSTDDLYELLGDKLNS